MDYDQLASFLEVARLQSFSRAAEKIYRTQPAISAQVRLLEQECGERLFNRSGKRVQLTPAGEILQGYAQKMIDLHRDALQAIAELNQTARGKLFLGANEATCLYVLPKTFARFRQLYPLVQISIYRSFSHKIVQKVQEGAVEVGVVTLPQNVPNLEVLPVHRDEMQVVMPANHPLAKQRSVTLDEMVQYPLIMPKTGRTRVMLDRLLRDKRNELQISMELASVETIKKFVGAGLGLSLLSKSYAQAEVAAGLLKLVPLEGIKIQRELGLIYRRDRYLSLPAKVFIEAVRASIHPLKREGGAQAEKNAAGPGPESDTE
ncbi:MAG TPA: LysR family transcriptional regulator [Terriglobia bacterium]|jgi:DNA-binding transcriptional LysR family regulator|nr:LysR family transcriptional regulator [Terriglobia bacterium]